MHIHNYVAQVTMPEAETLEKCLMWSLHSFAYNAMKRVIHLIESTKLWKSSTITLLLNVQVEWDPNNIETMLFNGA